MDLKDLKPATIRTGRKRLLDSGTPEPQAVKAYRLLRAVLNTAMKEDGLIKDNACRIKGYDKYHTPERTAATVEQVFALAGAVPERYRAFIIVAAFSGPRWGELVALRRCDVDLADGAAPGTPEACGSSKSAGVRPAEIGGRRSYGVVARGGEGQADQEELARYWHGGQIKITEG
jgi:hypothetical protein